MSQDKIHAVQEAFQVDRPVLSIGDTVVVDTVIRDGDKQRIQKFKGIVIAIQGKKGNKTFTVRKVSYGIGVEKIFPFNSPTVAHIEIVKHAQVRRSKLYYLRDRVGKAATMLKGGAAVTDASNEMVTIYASTDEKNTSQPSDEVEASDSVEVSTEESKEVISAEAAK